jgi:hypothetical protein
MEARSGKKCGQCRHYHPVNTDGKRLQQGLCYEDLLNICAVRAAGGADCPFYKHRRVG